MCKKLFTLLLIPIIIFIAMDVSAFSFSGYNWIPDYNATGGFFGCGHNYLSTLTAFNPVDHNDSVAFPGFQGWDSTYHTNSTYWQGNLQGAGLWSRNDSYITTENGHEVLHLRFYNDRNTHFYDSTDTKSNNWSDYHKLVTWRNIYDPLGHGQPNQTEFDKCVILLNAMRDDSVWYGNSVHSDTVFKYGTFHWDIKNSYDFEKFDEHIHPEMWISDDKNEYSTNDEADLHAKDYSNEIDFELGRFDRGPDSGRANVTVQAWGRNDGTNVTVDPHQGNRYLERQEQLSIPSEYATSTYQIIYRGESVNFQIGGHAYHRPEGWTDHQEWTFPIPQYANLARQGDTVDCYATGVKLREPRYSFVVPSCGDHTHAIMGLGLWGDTPLWASVDSSNIPFVYSKSVEMLVTGFSYTGIPDVSFYADTNMFTDGNPEVHNHWYPHPTNSGVWDGPVVASNNLYGTNAPVHNTVIYDGDVPKIYWAVHNIGTADMPDRSQGSDYRVRLYVDNVLKGSKSILLAKGSTDSGLVDTVHFSEGPHHIRLENYDTSQLEELRVTNNSFDTTIYAYSASPNCKLRYASAQYTGTSEVIDAKVAQTPNKKICCVVQKIDESSCRIRTIDVTNPENIGALGVSSTYSFPPGRIAVNGDSIWMCSGPTLKQFVVNDAGQITLQNTYDMSPYGIREVKDILILGGRIFATLEDFQNHCDLIDVDVDKVEINEIFEYIFPTSTQNGSMRLAGSMVGGVAQLVLLTGTESAKVYQMGTEPVSFNYRYAIQGTFQNVDVEGKYAYLVRNDANGSYVDKYYIGGSTAPTAPISTQPYGQPYHQIQDINVSHSFAYVSDLQSGLKMIQLQSNPIVEYGKYGLGGNSSICNTVYQYPETNGTCPGEYVFDVVFDGNTYDLECYKPEIPNVYSPNGGESVETNQILVTWNGYSGESNPSNVTVTIGLDARNSNWRYTTQIPSEPNDGSGSFTPDGSSRFTYTKYAKVSLALNSTPNTSDTSDGYFTYGSSVLPTTLAIHDAYINAPVTVPSGQTVNIDTNANITFADSGRIIVPTGSTLHFNYSAGSCTRVDCPTKDAPEDWHAIEVQSGGKVIGKNVRFSNLPYAITSACGQVKLDSVFFDTCTIGINFVTLIDTIAISHSTFTHCTTGIYASGSSTTSSLSITNCTFTGPTCYSIFLNNLARGTIDHCDLEGVNYETGMYLQQCSDSVSVMNTKISSYATGIESLYSNVQFCADTIVDNVKCGINWSNNFPGDKRQGLISSSVIRDNGSDPFYVGGLCVYAADPIVTCTHFSGNYPYAVNALGNSAPSFYDPIQKDVGSNNFYGIEGFPIIYIVDSSPVFVFGGNAFHLPANLNGLYMRDDSNNPVLHAVQFNEYLDGDTISYFKPANPSNWVISPQSSSKICGAPLGDFVKEGEGKLMEGDLELAENQTDSAVYWYTSALTGSGDTTAAGMGALSRLAKISPILPLVGEQLANDRWYNSSYSYDAVADFSTADIYRDSILTTMNGNDSARVEYDQSVSELLRPTTNKMGSETVQDRTRLQAHRRDLFDKLLKKVTKITQKIADRVIEVPKEFALHNAYPNPFNPVTSIRFDLPKTSPVKLIIYNALGRQVTTLVSSQSLAAGYHEVKWNAQPYASGVYFCRMEAGAFTSTKKLMLLK